MTQGYDGPFKYGSDSVDLELGVRVMEGMAELGLSDSLRLLSESSQTNTMKWQKSVSQAAPHGFSRTVHST